MSVGSRQPQLFDFDYISETDASFTMQDDKAGSGIDISLRF